MLTAILGRGSKLDQQRGWTGQSPEPHPHLSHGFPAEGVDITGPPSCGFRSCESCKRVPRAVIQPPGKASDLPPAAQRMELPGPWHLLTPLGGWWQRGDARRHLKMSRAPEHGDTEPQGHGRCCWWIPKYPGGWVRAASPILGDRGRIGALAGVMWERRSTAK